MTETRALVVGGAGFIGSHMVDCLVVRGPVTIYDNLSIGSRAKVADPLASGWATLIEADALDLERLTAAMTGCNLVVHFSANPEARWGLERTRLDLEQGTIVTYNVLEAMRRTGVRRLLFASSGTVYGDTAEVCAEGDLGALPISLYGASKLAGEALVSAFASCFDVRACIFRFGNVVGPRGTHGVALDFLKKLRDSGARARAEHTPIELEVLGDGLQAKPYLHVTDCVAGMLFGLDHASAPLSVWNLTPPDTTSVARIAELCIAASPHKDALIRYTGGDRGWRGDVPRSRMSPEKLAALGFRVRHTSDGAVRLAIEALAREVFG